MKKIIVVIGILLTLSVSISIPDESSRNNPLSVQIGSLTLPLEGYGDWCVYPVLTNSEGNKDYQTFGAHLSLWIGATISDTDRYVVTGTGISPCFRPSFTPTVRNHEIHVTSFLSGIGVSKIYQSCYNDLVKFNGHYPLGLDIQQRIYTFKNKDFIIFEFNITNLGSNGNLYSVNTGLMADFDLPKTEDYLSCNHEIIGINQNGTGIYVKDVDEDWLTAPIVGVDLISEDDVSLNYWESGKMPESHDERYEALKENKKRMDSIIQGDYCYLMSGKPFDLKIGQTKTFVVVLIQTQGKNDCQKAVSEAQGIYWQIAGKFELKKESNQLTTKLPIKSELYQNYPNPFNPSTTIKYQISQPGNVSVSVYNLMGEKMITLIDRHMEPGSYCITWDGKDASGYSVPNGLYFYSLETTGYFKTMKMVLMK